MSLQPDKTGVSNGSTACSSIPVYMEGKIERAALGRGGNLGDLYNARKDTFCGTNILKCQPNTSAVVTTTTENPLMRFRMSDTWSEKFNAMDVDGNMKLSVLAGLLGLRGSGRYLYAEKKSARSVRGTFSCNVKTQVEQMNFYKEDLKKIISMDALCNSEDATHVVVEVVWGGNFILTVEHENSENRDKKEIEEALLAKLPLFKNFGDTEGTTNSDENTSNCHFKLDLFADVLPDSYEVPQSIETAVEFMRDAHKEVKKANGGKGKELVFGLIPLSKVKEALGIKCTANAIVHELDSMYVDKMQQVFEDLLTVKQQVHDLYNDVLKYNYCLLDTAFSEVERLKHGLEAEEGHLRSRLSALLEKIRAGEAKATEIEELKRHYEDNEYSVNNTRIALRYMEAVRNKLDLAACLEKRNVEYVSVHRPLEIIRRLHQGKQNHFVLEYKEEWKREDPELWDLTWNCFLKQREQESDKNTLFAFVDGDNCAATDLRGSKLAVLCVQNGRVTTHDLIGDLLRDTYLPLARSDEGLVKTVYKPTKRALVEFPCPGSLVGECDRGDLKWLCSTCRKPIEYGFDDYFYCQCGRGQCRKYSYRCGSERHGDTDFLAFEEERLAALLSRMRPVKELNILILGETGVGKSTWINGFAHYLHFDTLDEAINGDNMTQIPTFFTMLSDDTYEEICIVSGTDSNEKQDFGYAGTQFPKSHTFYQGDTLIRLIDTPGIGDPLGITQDKINFENILRHISCIPEIHGICILMKPNESRLTVVFHFCIQELLSHLHRAASRNIVFCFTNTRGYFYKPSASLPPLRKLLTDCKRVDIPLSRSTIYCFDSEAVRFLAAYRQGVHFSEDDQDKYSVSWTHSRNEIKRLLDHFKSLPPHNSRDMLAVNDARRVILCLTEPLAIIAKRIAVNETSVKAKIVNLKEKQIEAADLERNLYRTVTDFELEDIDMPKTVCTSYGCTRIVEQGDRSVQQFTQICHSTCFLKNVLTDTYPMPDLKNCLAMDQSSGVCRKCGCSWEKHMHIRYNYKEVQKSAINPHIQRQLNEGATKEAVIKAQLAEWEKELAQLEAEKTAIFQSCSRFAQFLKDNAILPYNDAVRSYLTYLIKREKELEEAGAAKSDRKNFEDMLAAYEEQVRILEHSIQNSDASGTTAQLAPQDIKNLVDSLYNLTLNGKDIRKFVKMIEDVDNGTSRYLEQQCISRGSRGGRKKRERHPPHAIRRLYNAAKAFIWY